MKTRTLSVVRFVTLMVALIGASFALKAQVLYGSLTGNVTDPSDAAVPGAKVDALNVGTGALRNYQSLLYLIPGDGIPATMEANSDAGNPQRAQTLFMNGVSSTGNSTRIDGTTIAYPWLPVNVAYIPPSEAIEAVNVVTNAF